MDNQEYNSIVSFIWGIADDCLRDVYVRGKYRDVILPMTVIRRLDAMLEETKLAVLTMKKQLDSAKIDNQWPALCNAAGQAFCNASPFLLKDLTSRGKAQTLKKDFEAYLDGFSPNVQLILDKFKFRNQIDTMVDADILGSVIEKFTSSDINLSPNPIYKDDAKTILKHPGLDNHGMGTIFEELIRKFNEENNEEAGEHWTPRDVVELMADLVFVPIEDKIKDASYSCYDGACGTGGMLTVAQDRLQTLAKRRGKEVAIHLFGQEINPETYAICTADMLLKGDGEEAEHIMYGSTLSNDQHASRQFDFMLSNPPYGKSWKTDAEKMGGKKDILDTRFNTYLEGGETMAMIPRVSDGQLLFLLNNIAKMKKDTDLGSRIAEVHNGSSLFTGDAGSGESNARRFMIENDLVEAIIALPDNMFYNTGIGTFIWILSNNKEERRKGKIQLIDASKMKSAMPRNMGKKNCEFTSEIRKEILRIFLDMEESEVSKVFNNDDFGFWSVTVERPLRLHVYPERKIPDGTFKKTEELKTYEDAIACIPKDTPLDDWTAFAKATKLKAAMLKKVRPFITERQEQYDKAGNLDAVMQQAIRIMRKRGAADTKGAGNELGEIMIYAFLEEKLKAYKLLSKIELSTDAAQYMSEADGIHFLCADGKGTMYNQMVFGASNIVGDIKDAIDQAFESIKKINEHEDSEIYMIEKTVLDRFYDKDDLTLLKGNNRFGLLYQCSY